MDIAIEWIDKYVFDNVKELAIEKLLDYYFMSIRLLFKSSLNHQQMKLLLSLR
jgi:hypothetical protein